MRSLDADFKEQVDIYARRGTFINSRAFPLALSHETVKVFLRNEEAFLALSLEIKQQNSTFFRNKE